VGAWSFYSFDKSVKQKAYAVMDLLAYPRKWAMEISSGVLEMLVIFVRINCSNAWKWHYL